MRGGVIISAPPDVERRRVEHLAQLLRRVAPCAPLPVLQALAAVAVNRRADAGGRPDRLRKDFGDGYIPLCRRVARRAVRGLTADPTDGALRCHHRRNDPAWARGRIPCAEIGAYLFYR